MQIRLGKPEDAEGVTDVHIRGWQAAYRGQVADAVLDALPQSRERRVLWWREHADGMWIAEEDGQVIGFARIGATADADAPPGTGEVYLIYLAPEAWGKGVGRELFAKIVAELRVAGYARATLWVLDTNDRAQRFYRAAGWTPDGGVKTDERAGVTLRELRFAIKL